MCSTEQYPVAAYSMRESDFCSYQYSKITCCIFVVPLQHRDAASKHGAYVGEEVTATDLTPVSEMTTSYCASDVVLLASLT